MIGIVLVSHSAVVAEGVAALAAQMAAPEVRICAAGGLDEPGVLGTDAARVLRAVEAVWSDDGVLVLMDLGSAVLSAEMAVDLLDDERSPLVLLTEAPFLEGAVAAAVAAGLGEPLEACAAEARRGLEAKAVQLGREEPGAGPATGPDAAEPAGEPAGAGEPAAEARVVVTPPLGLHARPAALLVRTAAGFDARVTVADLTSSRGPVSARSLSAVATLGARRGDVLLLTATGPDAQQALAALRRLADEDFGGEPALATACDASRGTGAARPAPIRQDTLAGGAAPGTVLVGVAASPGLASGRAGRLRASAPAGPAPPAGDAGSEWRALELALAATATELRQAQTAVAAQAAAADAAILGAHLLFLEDEELLTAARRRVRDGGETAAAAWTQAVAEAADAWDRVEDAYQRERAEDLRAVGAQVAAHLAGGGHMQAARGTEVLVAADLSPSQVAALRGSDVRALACAAGSPTAHAAILARAMGLPAVVAVGPALLTVPDGATLVVDGGAGSVTVDPTAAQLVDVERRREEASRGASAARAAAARPAVTRDGVRVLVEANIATPDDAAAAAAAGADGVGLLRTEFLFLDMPDMPSEDEQAEAYDRAAAALDGLPLTVRTLDAGADKPLPYLPRPPEANPFLGLRGLRLGLARPELLLPQLRAVLRVAARRPLRVMFPMVATAREVRDALDLLEQAEMGLRTAGVAAGAPEVGVMVEVPSAALTAESLAPLVDFLSLGTNDLAQYTLAAERGNAALGALGDALHPAVLRLIAGTAAAATRAGRRVSVCGEIAGDTAALPLLVGLGVRELSVTPVLVPAVKAAVRAVDVPEARRLAAKAQDAESAEEVRALLAESGR